MSLLRELAGHPEYVKILKEAERMRPALPEWDPATNNAEEWKHKSAMRQGYDLALALFVPK